MSARAGREIIRLPLGESRLAARRRALLGDSSRRSASSVAGAGQRSPRYRIAPRLPVRGRRGPCQGADGGSAQRQRTTAGSGAGADRCRRHLVHGAAASVSEGAAAIFRADRLARNARCHPIATRIYRTRGCNSGWDHPPISWPIRSRADARSMWSRSCREPGTRRAGALLGDALELKNAFAASRWPGPARMMINAVDGWRKWALFTLPEGGEWTSGAIGLLGDATHAMLPFAAQGAGMAIEDAAVLAKCLERGPRRHRGDRGCGAEALCAAAPDPRGAGAAHRTQLGANLPSHRTRRIGARPHDQGLGR